MSDSSTGRERRLVTAVVLVVVLAVVPYGPFGHAQAAGCTTITEATVISAPGCYVVGESVEEHEDGEYIVVEASDVVVDGDGHTLDGGGNNNAVHVDGSYSNVTVHNLTVTNWDRGVFVKDVTDATVRDVTGTANKHTVELDATTAATVDGVSASADTESGIYVKDATATTVVDSEVTDAGRHGLFVDGGDATVESVTADTNAEHGVHLKNADGSTVRAVTASDNTLHGVSLEATPDGLVVDSTADTNGDAGVRIHHSDGTAVTNVSATGNAHGVHLSSGTTALNDSRVDANAEGIRLQKHVHTVANVTVESSTDYGVFLDEADDNVVHGSRINDSGTAGIYVPDDRPENNLFYDNYLDNADNVRFAGSVPPTDWNVSRRTGTNVVGGALVGGNYWAAPDGTGPSQQFDNDDRDAFLDTPYAVAPGQTDGLPLTDVTSAFDVTPASHDFGAVGIASTTTRSFTVENRAGSDATVDGFTLAGDTSSFSVTSDPTPVTLASGGTTTVEVTLTPDTSGDLSATLTVDATTDAYDTDVPLAASVSDTTDPTAATGTDATVDEDTSLGFDGSASTDDVGIVSYEWAFGDGTSSTGATPTHTYATPGIYTATLTVTDGAGNTDTATRVVTVSDVTSPVAEAGASRTVEVGTSVSFDGTASTDNVGVDSYAWAFGDSNGASGATATNTYTTEGTYTATLTTSDAAGNTASDTATIDVVSSIVPIPDPGSDRTVDEDSPVPFDGSGSTDADGTIESYAWDFGVSGTTADTAAGPTASYTYADPGTYTATLTVTDDDGRTASSEALVTVADVTAPTVDAGGDTTADEDTSVTFSPATATDNVGVASTEWAFGDGDRSTDGTPSHTYATPGTYTATLTLTDDAGNTASDTRTVTVNDVTSPVAATASTSSKTVSLGQSIPLDGSASTDNVGVASYDWTFGDGNTGTGAAVSHTYAAPGTYTVTLTVTDAAGNSDTETVTVYVSDATDPVPATGGDRTVAVGDSLTLDGSGSTDNVGVDSYTWYFADGTTATGATATRAFETAGSYSITLTVRDAAGNRASDGFVVTVEEETSGGGGGASGAPVPSTTTATPGPTATPEPTPEPSMTPEPTVQSAERDVTAEEPVSFDFAPETEESAGPEPAADVGVTDIGFTPAVSEPVSMRVTTGRELGGSPDFDREDNTALVSNVRVDHSIDNADVSDVSVGFRVSTARLAAMDTPAEDVALYRHRDGTWTELPTEVVSESADAVVFRASSPGLSEFAVGAKQPKFALQSVRVDVEEIRVGDDLRVFVRITNDGGADGSFVANLLVGGTLVESRELTIAAGGRRQVRFERPIGRAGAYTVRVNDAVAGEVIVTRGDDGATSTAEPEGDASGVAAAATTTPPTTSADGSAKPGVVGVVALFAVVAGAVGYRRHRSH